jgi:hypothetical protein
MALDWSTHWQALCFANDHDFLEVIIERTESRVHELTEEQVVRDNTTQVVRV